MRPEHKEAIRSALQSYTSIGGYPIYLVTSDGGSLCPQCVRDNLKEIVSAARHDDGTGGWLPLAADINWEDSDLYCDHCGHKIQSAYSD